MKRVAILQSNYIPWKGYFDIIASVDEFIIYDDVQFTKNDWRNRNKIKTQKGLQWLTVPVGQDINRLIKEVKINNSRWQTKHWASILHAYKRASYFDKIASALEPLYFNYEYSNLSHLNRTFIEFVCNQLGIKTKISNSWDYELVTGQTERLISICEQAGACEYISGPSARTYINQALFVKANIKLTWFEYSDYLKYSQLWGDFEHFVSVIDLLFNVGSDAEKYIKNLKYLN